MCIRDRPEGDLQLNPSHALSCSHLRADRTRRHNGLVRLLHDVVTEIGGYARIEPRSISELRNERPDLDVRIGAARFLVDVTIRDPLCISNVRLASQGSLKLAEKAAADKVAKYSVMAQEAKAQFVPFAIETFGGMCKAAAAWVKNLKKIAAQLYCSVDMADLISEINQNIAIALARDNASAVASCLHRSAK